MRVARLVLGLKENEESEIKKVIITVNFTQIITCQACTPNRLPSPSARFNPIFLTESF